jgi:hypothetical protein
MIREIAPRCRQSGKRSHDVTSLCSTLIAMRLKNPDDAPRRRELHRRRARRPILVAALLQCRPLYRQHRRLIQAGFELTRSWLTQSVGQAAQRVDPIYEARLDAIRASRGKAVDETPIMAGRAGPGKMKAGYFWPAYGERGERGERGEHGTACFPLFWLRRHGSVRAFLGDKPQPGEMLPSDGYAAYRRCAEATGGRTPNAGRTHRAASSRPSTRRNSRPTARCR